jgi:MFS family permease
VIALFTATFVGFGGLLVLLGTTQEALAESLGLGLADTGQLAAALSLGLAVGVAGAGPLVDRAPRRPLFVAANLLAGATLSLADAGWGRAGIATAVATVGFAAGSLETLMNAAIADRYAERAARPLAGVHVGVNLGAVAAPPLLGALAAASGWPGAFRALGALFLLIAVLGTLVPLPRPRGHAARAAGGSLPLGALLPLGLVAACYVGLETGRCGEARWTPVTWPQRASQAPWCWRASWCCGSSRFPWPWLRSASASAESSPCSWPWRHSGRRRPQARPPAW